MASQADARISEDRRPGRYEQPYTNGGSRGQYEADISRPRFVGPAAQEEFVANPSTSSSPQSERRERNDESTRNIAIREKSRSRANGSVAGKGSGSLRICTKCGEVLPGQYVRALGGTWHLECFKCRECGQVVASKFFPSDDGPGTSTYPLCETDYFRRLDLLCHDCGGALRGSYITALDRKYHIEHFTCSVCPTIFGAEDSYYEHEDKVYCHYHYSTRFAQRCTGCQTAILKQFVECFRNGVDQHWHPECYMIHRYWSVKIAPSTNEDPSVTLSEKDATDQMRGAVRHQEEHMEEKVYKIWSVLSTFEESSAACISDMLLHVSNGAVVDGVVVAKKFIWHVDILYTATDRLDSLMTAHGMKGLSNPRESKNLVKKVIQFFGLLTKTQETGVRKLGVTQELLSLVTGLAHYLKLLIRISLQGALKFEREQQSAQGLDMFLEGLGNLEPLKKLDESQNLNEGVSGLVGEHSDLCHHCQERVEEACAKAGTLTWHIRHLQCGYCQRLIGDEVETTYWLESEQRVICQRDFQERNPPKANCIRFQVVSRLKQYVHLLRVALARLLALLKSASSLPHTSDDPNLARYDSDDGHRVGNQRLEPPLLRSNTRSKSYAGSSKDDQNVSSYEETVGEMKRLRSTRMDKTLSMSMKKARTSRVIEASRPEGEEPGQKTPNFRVIEESDPNKEVTTELPFGNQDGITLDDIPRLVASQQAKEQRPNASKYARSHLPGVGPREPRIRTGHRRDFSGGNELDVGGDHIPQRTKKYFSELSALEYFIVRHVAVLSMQPLLEGHYTLEDLLGLIEVRKPGGLWSKFGKAFQNNKQKASKKKGVFGVPLDVLVERDGVDCTHGIGPGAMRVPAFVDDSISAMRQMDMSIEGIFRKNGNIRGLSVLAEKIDAKEEEVDLVKEGPVQIGALMKRFFRDMPDPLLTSKLHRLFITSQKINDEEKRRRVLHLTCCLLPKHSRDTFEVLASFLVWFSSFAQVDEESGSKMDLHNVATVIAPNILKDYSTKASGKDPLKDKTPISEESYFLAIEAVNSLLEYNDQMCEVPEDLQSILNDSSLFNDASADITTKEILKRYGDTFPQSTQTTTSHRPNISSPSPPSTKDSITTPRAAVTRVDTDPYQARAWDKESSVRHVGDTSVNNSGHHLNGQPNRAAQQNSGYLGPREDFAQPHSPFANVQHQRQGSADSGWSGRLEQPNTPGRQARNSGWKQQQPGVGVGT